MVDRVICDLPSTGFFECIFSGLPVVTFDDKENKASHKDAFSILGNSLKSYTTIEEKLKIVEIFLNETQEKYIVNISEDNSSVIKTLNDNIIK